MRPLQTSVNYNKFLWGLPERPARQVRAIFVDFVDNARHGLQESAGPGHFALCLALPAHGHAVVARFAAANEDAGIGVAYDDLAATIA